MVQDHDQLEQLSAYFGRRLRGARRAANLTQDALSERSGVGQDMISRYEQGRSLPSLPTLCRLAGELAVPITYFFPDDRLGTLSDDQRDALHLLDTLSPLALDYVVIFVQHVTVMQHQRRFLESEAFTPDRQSARLLRLLARDLDERPIPSTDRARPRQPPIFPCTSPHIGVIITVILIVGTGPPPVYTPGEPPMDFAALYNAYVEDIAHAQRVDNPEAEIVTRFSIFMAQAFSIEPHKFRQEQTIHMAQIEATGRIDLLFGGLVLEFKRKLTKKTDPRQLENYLRGLADRGETYTGVFTDGLEFWVYTLDDDGFRRIDEFKLNELPAATARVRLDAYLFSQHSTPPTADDIVFRYGITSPTFRKVAAELRRLLAQVQGRPMLSTWRAQWQRLLSRVYGSNLGDDELFVRHTYLSQFARLLAYSTLHGIPQDQATVRDIISGAAFRQSGVDNIAEADFFSWVLMDDIADEALRLFEGLAQTFVVYNLRQIDQDLLKQLYQSLVDVKDRHDLGEYYTPDWLAELTLRDIDYAPGQSLYDPTCGSGSFLFSAIKHLRKRGMHGAELVEFAVNNVMGTDIHPLAVTIARINYLLALSEDLKAANNLTGATRNITIPVYMADAMPRPVEGEGGGLRVPIADLANSAAFIIPEETARVPALMGEMIDLIEKLARTPAPDIKRFGDETVRRHAAHGVELGETTRARWAANLTLLKTLIDSDRNRIWAFILNNIARPLAFRRQKFDVVAGNPPWLSYRYIKNKDYQADVKALYSEYGLIEPGQGKLVTQMDLSSLFYEVARDRYLKPGGTLAFVLPRSLITGAKQHRAFQRKGITRALDMKDVTPLFNVPTAVLVYTGAAAQDVLPMTAYTGRLPAHEMELEAAEPHLTHTPAQLHFVEDGVRSPHYHEAVFQGATLVPRNFCFVVPEGLPSSPAVTTDPEMDRDAKPPYKGVHLRGVVHDPYYYATLLSKHLVPFGYERLHAVALPFTVGTDGRLVAVTDPDDYIYNGHASSGEWFQAADAHWGRYSKDGETKSFLEQLNFRNKITNQNPRHPYKVIYNASGSNVSATVLDMSAVEPLVHQRRTQAFVVDHKAYYYDATSLDEAHYLCAVLNAESVNDAIKAYQSYGLMGARDVHRTPFEACGIPPFDADNPDHMALARLSHAAHEAVALLKANPDGLAGGVAKMRESARAVAAAQLDAIDEIVRRIVEM